MPRPSNKPFTSLSPILSLVLLFMVAAVGCGEDDLPAQADFVYQVRCSGSPGCSSEPIRPVPDLEGERRFDDVTCSVSDGQLNFTVRGVPETGEPYSLRVQRAGSPNCLVRVEEGGNTYGGDRYGACSPSAPSDSIPCQVTFTTDGDVITGNIHCQRIPQRGNPTTHHRSITGAGSQGPATFTFENC